MPPKDPTNYLFLDSPFYSAVCLLIIYLVLYAEIIIHELGHWLAALTFRHRILALSVGDGLRLWKTERNNCFYIFNLFPSEGYILHLRDRPKTPWWEDFLVSAAGPIGTALCLGVLCLFRATGITDHLPDPWPLLSEQMILVLITLSTLTLFYNLLPLRAGQSATDGRHMVEILRTMRTAYPSPDFYTAAVHGMIATTSEDAGEIPELNPNRKARDLLARYYAQSHQERWDEAFACLKKFEELPDLSAPERTGFMNEFANLAMASGQREHLRTALEMNRAARDIRESDYLKMREGHLLIELQYYDDGREILLELMEPAKQVKRIKVDCLAGLALASARQLRWEEAKKHLAAAKAHQYRTELLLRAQNAVSWVPDGG